MKLPDPVAYLHQQGNYSEATSIPLLDDEKDRGWTEVPLFTEAQVRELLALAAMRDAADKFAVSYSQGYDQAKRKFEAENEANERNLCQLTDDLAESRREVAQLQEQNTALDAKLAQQEAVMRQALETLKHGKPMFDAYWGGTEFDDAIEALEGVLK